MMLVTKSTRRVGRFKISGEFLRKAMEDGDYLGFIFGEFVIVRAETLFDENTIVYTAYSELFEEVPLGTKPPMYNVIIQSVIKPIPHVNQEWKDVTVLNAVRLDK